MSRYVPDRPDWRRYQARLDALREARYNVDLSDTHGYTETDGWHIDSHTAELPSEPPGAPLPPDDPRASFAIAWGLIRDYEFPDPSLVTGIFSPDGPLAERPMLLRARFLGLSFWFGVRVVRAIDETREAEGGTVHARGFSYATLEGHFERGEITFEVRKAEASGAVTFHIDAFSQPDRIGNPFYRLGFKIFGRGLQQRFARTAMDRMQRFTADELRARADGRAAPARDVPDVGAPPPEAPDGPETMRVDPRAGSDART